MYDILPFDSSGFDVTSAVVGFGVLAGVFTIIGLAISVFMLVMWVATIVGQWRVFTKAGVAGWQALIPFWSNYVLGMIAEEHRDAVVEGDEEPRKWIPIAYAVLAGCAWALPTIAYNFTAIGSLCGIAAFVFGCVVAYNIAKIFDKGVGFVVGLVLLPGIFYCILGFGPDEYDEI